MFVVALFTKMVELSESRNNPNAYQLISVLTDYQAIKIDEVLTQTVTQVNLENTS